LPQVQSIRDLLDGDAFCMVVKERELRQALIKAEQTPKLVVTDSQAFLKVNADTPFGNSADLFLHTFCAVSRPTLMKWYAGAMAIDNGCDRATRC
jgi:hypothetical protein